MTRRVLLTAILAAAPVLAADSPAKAVEKADRDWAAGIVKNDFALLEKVLANDLTYTHSNGNNDTKESYIGGLKSGKFRYTQMDLDNIKVNVLSKDVAITTSRAKGTALVEGKQTPFGMVLLHVFRLKGGQWQLVAHQSARLP
jgi:ketosteroid isomerase-like protein